MNPSAVQDVGGPPAWCIRAAVRNDIPHIRRIELAAAERFVEIDWLRGMRSDPTPLDTILRSIDEGGLWVAAVPGRLLVGFMVSSSLGDYLQIDELDVLPEYGRRGIGSSLVKLACARAVDMGKKGVVLTTFRDIPWNEPFYRRLGFHPIGHDSPVASVRSQDPFGVEHAELQSRRVALMWRADG